LHRIVCLAALALCASGARADRLIWIPTAATGRLQAEYMTRVSGSEGVLTGQIGLGRQVELLARHYRNFDDDDTTEIGGQYVVLPEGFVTPGVAIGVWDVADEGPRGRRIFGVVTKTVPVVNALPLGINDIKVHAGIGSNALSGVFFGAEASIPFGLRLYAEYDARNLNAGLAWSPLPLLSLKAESWDGDIFVGARLVSPL
jgi:hypothetical protein